MAFVSNPSPSEDNQSSSGTDLNIVNTEDEMHIDTMNWTPAKRKKLQHMTKFHEEYQWIFGEKASIHTIMKRGISHMNPPMLHRRINVTLTIFLPVYLYMMEATERVSFHGWNV